MRSIFAPYVNEMLKTIRKISIWIILGAMVVVVIGMGALIKLQSNASQTQTVQNGAIGIQKQQMLSSQNSYKKQLSDIQAKIKTANNADLPALKQQESQIQTQIDMLQYAYDHDIILYGYKQSYRAQALQSLYQYKGEAAQLKEIPAESLTADQKSELAKDEDYITRLQKVLDDKDFSGYIALANEMIKDNTDMTADEKSLQTETNDLKLKYNDTGEGNTLSMDAVTQQINQIETDRRSLLENLDYAAPGGQPKPLTDKRRTEIQNDISVNNYKLDHGIGKTTGNGQNYADTSIGLMEYIGSFVLVILMLILAGSSISQEIATGSIKSLIISPIRRWKILTAKILSLLTVLIVSGLFLYAVSFAVNGLLYGFQACSPYVYASGGIAHEIPFSLFYLAFVFVGLIEALILSVFALMLSVITKNTAASVGISMGVYFAGSLLNTILVHYFNGEWVDFLPFNNMDLSLRLFPSNALSQSISGSSAATGSSLTFIVCYLAVLLLCMGWTTYDSFVRRDIK